MTKTSNRRAARRTMLKGAAALAGVAAGSRAITGFPAVHAAGAEGAALSRHRGEPVHRRSPKKVKDDTGIKIEYVAVTTDDVTKRVVTQPNSLRPGRHRVFLAEEDVPSGNLMGMDTKTIKIRRQDHADLHQGRIAERQEDRRPGHRAEEGDLPRRPELQDLRRRRRPQWMTLIPTVYNADTLGIRPDLIKRPIESWTELLNPEFKGKAAILNIPSIGIMDAAMVVEATGELQVRRQGQHDQGRDRPHDQDA